MSMLSVYFLMLANSIKGFLFIIGLFGTAGFIIACCVAMFSSRSAWTPESEFEAWRGRVKRFAKYLCFAPFFLVLGVFTPSTKTVAAMVVLPKITSPKALNAMGSEARDLYELAKQALSNAVDADQQK